MLKNIRFFFLNFCRSLGWELASRFGDGGMTWKILFLGMVAMAGGCTRGSINNALGTPKNPTAVFSNPESKYVNDQSKFIIADYGVLIEAIDLDAKPITMKPVGNTDMRRYLGAGYDLADAYCSRYFAKTDEAYRRRRFGRTLTNDVGTAVTTILGLVNAGESAVTALAATTGLADSAWRNYDDSFVISPELATVRSLVLAAQDNFRARTLGEDAILPGDFGTAHSTIRRYAELCSHLGMKSMLEQSATKQQAILNDNTEDLNKSQEKRGGAVPPAGVPASEQSSSPLVPAIERPATATPALTPNQRDDGGNPSP